MTKLLIAVLMAAFAFSAQAASHAGGAPMKDGAAAAAPAAPAKKAHKAMKTKKPKAAMKKEEMKK